MMPSAATAGRERSARQWIFRIAAIVVGLTALVFGMKEVSAARRLRSVGEVAVVQPIGGYTAHKSRGSTTYTAEFRFETTTGRKISKKHSFPEELLPELERGAPINVLYDPQNPSDFMFESEGASWLPVGMGVGFIAAAVLLL